MLAFFVPKNFWAIAFDSGGVTTGPMTVPFIMALGVGISSIRSDRHAGDDSFGLVALSSIGPVIAVLILGRLYPAQGSYIPVKIPDMDNSRTLAFLFADALPHYMKEVGIALAPILLFFLVFNFFALKMEKRSVLKILIGIVCRIYAGRKLCRKRNRVTRLQLDPDPDFHGGRLFYRCSGAGCTRTK